MDNITNVEFKTGQISLSADEVLEKAKDNYSSVILIGWDKEGFLDVRSTNNLDQKDCLWLVNTFSHKLLNRDYATE